MKIKTSGKIILIAIFVGSLFCAKVFWWDKNHPQVTNTNNVPDSSTVKVINDTLLTPVHIEKVKDSNNVSTVLEAKKVETKPKVVKPTVKKTVKKEKVKVLPKHSHEGHENSNNVIPNF